ncbi:MAG: Rrf2 family transcriptional regulator [Phycisphaeraceae bacterium]|nr:Rrf2 family transcriptional regulator [Phycisphaerales bacterium]MCB9842853.1 Rrf2 family transcriptional regulator [Phycisphaeraceae bacterium]
MYGKQTETAIAAMSRLAEVYDGGVTRLSSSDIAESRGLQRPFVAKILTSLSQAGLVSGSPGPGGGYTLARHPKEITVFEVFSLFERENDSDLCPFGGGVCGVGDPCAIHEKLVRVKDCMDDMLHRTTFDAFRIAFQVEGRRPTSRAEAQVIAGKARQSFRAPRPKRKN